MQGETGPGVLVSGNRLRQITGLLMHQLVV